MFFNGRHILAYLFVLVAAIPASAKTFQAGAPAKTPEAAAPQPNLPRSSTFNTSFFAPDVSDEDVLKQLWSEKSFEVRGALKHFGKRLGALIENKKPLKKYVNRVVDLLTADSPNVRNAAHDFIKKNAKTLFQQKLLSEAKIGEYSKQAYHSERNLWKFIQLLSALLPDDAEKTFMEVEYSFQILEGLISENPNVADTAHDILLENGDFLMKKNAWHLPHTKDFLLKFHDCPPANKIHFLKILEKNLEPWVNNQYLNKHDFLNAMKVLSSGDIDLRQEFIRLLTTPKHVATLNKLYLFDRAWAEALLADVKGDNHDRKQVAHHLLAYLMKPFIDNQNFTREDFNALWNYVSEHIDAFDDPFEIVNANAGGLTKIGWFTRRHFEKLLIDYPKRNVESRKRILGFVEAQYERFALNGWISATPLLPVVFGKPDDKEMLLMQLNFLNGHPDLINDKHIFGQEELKSFLTYLNHQNDEVFDLTVDIVDSGFDTWGRDKILNKALLSRLIQTEPSKTRTLRIFKVITNHFDHNLDLFDADSILALSDLTHSPLPDVAQAAKEFFGKHFTLMDSKKWVKQELIKNLKKSDTWEEFGLMHKRAGRRFKSTKKR